ncbi:hypothetical protein HPP92_025919 [Vanilla planifolia]|uniref:Uncharacterized protein n=1 Tax=Vanilla planifolia TaxID=51239 RepID=A0A835PIX2_VANPL|nr:hypothetical protein HPP92_025919 [Vanilla planifolia]
MSLPVCYRLIYEVIRWKRERNHVRSQEYRYCMRRSSVWAEPGSSEGVFDNNVFPKICS